MFSIQVLVSLFALTDAKRTDITDDLREVLNVDSAPPQVVKKGQGGTCNLAAPEFLFSYVHQLKSDQSCIHCNPFLAFGNVLASMFKGTECQPDDNRPVCGATDRSSPICSCYREKDDASDKIEFQFRHKAPSAPIKTCNQDSCWQVFMGVKNRQWRTGNKKQIEKGAKVVSFTPELFINAQKQCTECNSIRTALQTLKPEQTAELAELTTKSMTMGCNMQTNLGLRAAKDDEDKLLKRSDSGGKIDDHGPAVPAVIIPETNPDDIVTPDEVQDHVVIGKDGKTTVDTDPVVPEEEQADLQLADEGCIDRDPDACAKAQLTTEICNGYGSDHTTEASDVLKNTCCLTCTKLIAETAPPKKSFRKLAGRVIAINRLAQSGRNGQGTKPGDAKDTGDVTHVEETIADVIVKDDPQDDSGPKKDQVRIQVADADDAQRAANVVKLVELHPLGEAVAFEMGSPTLTRHSEYFLEEGPFFAVMYSEMQKVLEKHPEYPDMGFALCAHIGTTAGPEYTAEEEAAVKAGTMKPRGNRAVRGLVKGRMLKVLAALMSGPTKTITANTEGLPAGVSFEAQQYGNHAHFDTTRFASVIVKFYESKAAAAKGECLKDDWLPFKAATMGRLQKKEASATEALQAQGRALLAMFGLAQK